MSGRYRVPYVSRLFDINGVVFGNMFFVIPITAIVRALLVPEIAQAVTNQMAKESTKIQHEFNKRYRSVPSRSASAVRWTRAARSRAKVPKMLVTEYNCNEGGSVLFETQRMSVSVSLLIRALIVHEIADDIKDDLLYNRTIRDRRLFYKLYHPLIVGK